MTASPSGSASSKSEVLARRRVNVMAAVSSAPNTTDLWIHVSIDGGTSPRWDGARIVYRRGAPGGLRPCDTLRKAHARTPDRPV